MTIYRPPRREPRALALLTAPHGIAFAVCDPSDLRSVGIQFCRSSSHELAVLRLIRREKPTVIASPSAKLRRAAKAAASSLTIPVVRGPGELPPTDAVRDQLRQFDLQAPTPVLRRAACLAFATALTILETHRTYAPRNRTALRRPA